MIKVGDKVRCVDGKGMPSHGIHEGCEYIANSIQDMTSIGDKVYISVYVGGVVVYADATRFEVVEEV